VHGVSFPGGVRSGDVATVLSHVANRFHVAVESLEAGSCWGHNYRAVRGQVSGYSNHASGTAIDFNAPKHPIGVPNTFTPAQRAAIHAILAECGGAVRWGGDYSGRVDEMHFEINGGPALVGTIARHLRTPPQPIPTPEDKMKDLIFVRKPGTLAVFVGNGVTCRWIQNEQDLIDMQFVVRAHGGDDTIQAYSNLSVLGLLLGPVPPGEPLPSSMIIAPH
jgi:hypothetical protein